MTPRIAFAALVAAILGVGTIDYRTSAATARLYDESAPLERADYARCPKHQPDYRSLRYEVAHRADGGHWEIVCSYTED